jgi:hypothetical protein
MALPAQKISLARKEVFVLGCMRLVALRALALRYRLMDRGQEERRLVMANKTKFRKVSNKEFCVVAAMW